MENQKSLQLASEFTKPKYKNATSLIPKHKKYEQNYIVYRVKLNPIEVSEDTRDDILEALNANRSFIQIGKITVMLNSIASIEPMSKKKKPKKLPW